MDDIVIALNEVKRLQHRKELLSFVDSLWKRDASTGADIPWGVLDDDQVRVHLADVLLQANANELLETDTRPILEYVRTLVGSEDKSVAMAAVSALAASTDPKDVDILAAAADEKRDGVFRAAILSLAFMCGDGAAKALNEVAGRLQDEGRRRYLLETLEEAHAYKERTGACR